MKSGLLYFFAIVFLLFAFSGELLAQTGGASNVPVKALSAAPGMGSIKVTWTSESEVGVAHFELHRRSGSVGDFTCVCDDIQPLGDYQPYTIDDKRDLFKSQGTVFQYFVRVVMSDGTSRESEIISTYYNSTSSTAKRTWGSIKAMFR